MDLVYGGVSADILAGRITMTEIRAWPLPEWDADGSCEVAIDRVTARTGALDLIDELRLKVPLTGVQMPVSCLPPDLQEPAGLIGVTELDIPRVTFDLVYGLPAADATMRLHADVTELGSVDLSAAFAYLWFDGRDDLDRHPGHPVPGRADNRRIRPGRGHRSRRQHEGLSAGFR